MNSKRLIGLSAFAVLLFLACPQPTTEVSKDAALTEIIAPTGALDSGTVVTPMVSISNLETETETVPARLLIGTDYNDIAELELAPGQTDTLKFRTWTALVPGTLAVRCSTMLADDEHPGNDTLSTFVLVRAIDTARVEVAFGTDDGYVSVLVAYLPNPFGFIYSTIEQARVGVSVSGEDTLLARAAYRFNISDRQWGDVTLHLNCIRKQGNPGPVQAYCVPDLGTLPDTTTPIPQVVDWLWTAVDSGVKTGELTPGPGEWFEVTVPESTVTAMESDTRYLAFMFRLANETIGAGNWYELGNFEYAESHTEDKPYVTYPRYR